MNCGVLEITTETAPRLGAGLPDGSPLTRVVDKIVQNLAAGARVFLIEWEGRDVPRGAQVAGRTVTNADNGSIFDTDGVIGTIDRLVVDGGQTGHSQQVVAYVRN